VTGECEAASIAAARAAAVDDLATGVSGGSEIGASRRLLTDVTTSSVSAPPLLERLSAEMATVLPRSQSMGSTLPFSDTVGLRARAAAPPAVLPAPRPPARPPRLAGGAGRTGA